MGHGYQDHDRHLVDYQLWRLPGIDQMFRGPQCRALTSGAPFIAYLGAAQTFGRFVRAPFPTILADQLGVEALNLGRAGAGPSFFVRNDQLLEYVNRAAVVVVQIMSGRSESNSLFESKVGGEMLVRRSDGQVMGSDAAWRWAIDTQPRKQVDALIEENRHNWAEHYRKLLAAITAPKLLLWFSRRAPQYKRRYNDVGGLLGPFPQFVNKDWLADIKGHADSFVQCVNDDGWPQRLFRLSDGMPTTVQQRADIGSERLTHNRYYPSPEMHVAAAAALEPALNEVLP